MIYSEAAYDGVPVAHCASRDEALRLKRIEERSKRAAGRGTSRQRNA